MLRSLNVTDRGFWPLPNNTKLEDRLAVTQDPSDSKSDTSFCY